jgi:hypothetical protein
LNNSSPLIFTDDTDQKDLYRGFTRMNADQTSNWQLAVGN